MSAMHSRWRTFFTPLNLAAYVTWGVVSIEVWRTAGRLPAVGPFSARTAAIVLLLVYLAGFLLAAAMAPHEQPPRRALATASASLAIMLASTFGILWLGPTNSGVVLMIIIASIAAGFLPVWITAGLLLIVNLAMLALATLHWQLRNALLVAVLFAGFQAFAALASYAMRRAYESAEQLQQVNAHLLATRSLLAESARDTERLRLSRELHDVSGHKLTALKLNLAVLAKDPLLAGRRELEASREVADQLLNDIRGVVSQLRRHEGIDIRQALERLAEPLPFPRVHVEVAEDARVEDAERAEAFVRLAQEGLTNSARHASSQNVWLRLTRDQERLKLEVEDDGRAQSPLRPGHGLTGMRERVAALGGELEIGTASAGGLRVCAWLPRRQLA